MVVLDRAQAEAPSTVIKAPPLVTNSSSRLVLAMLETKRITAWIGVGGRESVLVISGPGQGIHDGGHGLHQWARLTLMEEGGLLNPTILKCIPIRAGGG